MQMSSSNMIAGTMFNSMARNFNNQSVSGISGSGGLSVARTSNASDVSQTTNPPGVGIAAVTTEEGMRGLGTNYMESFAAGYEQIYTPVFAYDQTDPARVKRNFNQGNI